MTTRVQPAEGGYALFLGPEKVGFCEVRMDGDTAVLPHVEVDPAHEGQGLASTLVRETLAILKGEGKIIRAQCPFVVAYLKKHPEEG